MSTLPAELPITCPQARRAVDLSAGTMLLVLFPKSSAHSYRQSVALARQAHHYEEMGEGRDLHHLAAFNRGTEKIGIASMLLDTLYGRRGVGVFVGGSYVGGPHVAGELMRCILQADQCEDYRAHCHQIVEDRYVFSDMEIPYTSVSAAGGGVVFGLGAKRDTAQSPIERWIVPCRFMAVRQISIAMRHPSSVVDQFQAKAVEKGCHVCPYFEARDLKKLAF